MPGAAPDLVPVLPAQVAAVLLPWVALYHAFSSLRNLFSNIFQCSCFDAVQLPRGRVHARRPAFPFLPRPRVCIDHGGRCGLCVPGCRAVCSDVGRGGWWWLVVCVGHVFSVCLFVVVELSMRMLKTPIAIVLHVSKWHAPRGIKGTPRGTPP